MNYMQLDILNPYYPYRVTGSVLNETGKAVFLGRINGVSYNDKGLPEVTLISPNGQNFVKTWVGNVRLLLHPLSQLKTLTDVVTGESLLKQMAFIEEQPFSITHLSVLKVNFKNDFGIEYTTDTHEKYRLYYKGNRKKFFKQLIKDDKCVQVTVQNPYELFQFLFRKHIDVFGLIPQGIAFDVMHSKKLKKCTRKLNPTLNS